MLLNQRHFVFSFFILFRLTEAASFGNIKIVFSFFVAPAIIIGVLFFKPIGAFLSLKPFKLIGNLSMLIYLLHFPVQCIIVLINEIFCLHINFASRITWALYVACIIFVVLIVDFFLVQIHQYGNPYMPFFNIFFEYREIGLCFIRLDKRPVMNILKQPDFFFNK